MTQAQQSPEGRWHEWTRGDRLRIARESVADSQSVFAELTSISKNTISRYENDAPAKELYVRQWAMATGYSFRWLMWGVVPEDTAADTTPVTQGYRHPSLVIYCGAA